MTYLISAIKIALFNLLLYQALKWVGLDMSAARVAVTQALAFWGSVMFFWGARHMLGAGFFAGIHGTRSWVDTATPATIWRLAGGLLWAIAIVCLFVMR